MGIYPKTNPGSNNIIGMDFNPSDGFSFYWNLGSIPEGSYYISANCVDVAAHTSEGITRMNLDCEQVILGDVNGDGRIDVSDAVYLINYIFNEGTEPLPSNDNGDVNCDGRLDVSDAVFLINFIFRDGDPPCN